MEHEYAEYGLLMLLGDMGGVLDGLVVISTIILVPIAEYSYVLKSLEKMFVAKT